MVGPCENDNEDGEFLDQMRDRLLLKNIILHGVN
jgi:hypothetical protein